MTNKYQQKAIKGIIATLKKVSYLFASKKKQEKIQIDNYNIRKLAKYKKPDSKIVYDDKGRITKIDNRNFLIPKKKDKPSFSINLDYEGILKNPWMANIGAGMIVTVLCRFIEEIWNRIIYSYIY